MDQLFRELVVDEAFDWRITNYRQNAGTTLSVSSLYKLGVHFNIRVKTRGGSSEICRMSLIVGGCCCQREPMGSLSLDCWSRRQVKRMYLLRKTKVQQRAGDMTHCTATHCVCTIILSMLDIEPVDCSFEFKIGRQDHEKGEAQRNPASFLDGWIMHLAPPPRPPPPNQSFLN